MVNLTPAAVDVTWTGGTDTAWMPGTGNWQATVGGAAATYGDGVNVTFDNTATGTTANIGANVSPATVTFNNSAKNYAVTGTSFGIGGTATVLKQGTGTVTMSSQNSYTGLTTIENGKLVLAAGAKTPVLSNAGVNLKFGKLVLDYNDSGTSPAAVDTLMKASYAGGNWNAGKFQSTTHNSADGLGWTADTITKLITVAYTLYGDASVDGSVNLSDLIALGANYNGAGGELAQGDFNYDGSVNLTDLIALGAHYNQNVAGFVTTGPAATRRPSPARWRCSSALPLACWSSPGDGEVINRRRDRIRSLKQIGKGGASGGRSTFFLSYRWPDAMHNVPLPLAPVRRINRFRATPSPFVEADSSRLFASSSLTNRSFCGSQCRRRPSCRVMLHRWQTVAERWPISTSALGRRGS